VGADFDTLFKSINTPVRRSLGMMDIVALPWKVLGRLMNYFKSRVFHEMEKDNPNEQLEDDQSDIDMTSHNGTIH